MLGFRCWVGFSLVASSGGLLSSCSSRASPCGGFSCGTWALGHEGVSSYHYGALEHRVSSCDTRAQLLHTMWYSPRPEIEPMFPALVAGFVTTKPPGKPQSPKVVVILIKICFKQHEQRECFIDSLFPRDGGTCKKLFWGKNLIDK